MVQNLFSTATTPEEEVPSPESEEKEVVTTPVELLEPPPVTTEEPLKNIKNFSIVAGQKVTKKDLDIFDLVIVENTNLLEASRQLDVDIQYIRKLKTKPWWVEMQSNMLESAQQEFATKLAMRGELIIEATTEILKGQRRDDKSTGSQVKLIELFTRIGKNPILQTNPNININHNTQNIHIEIDHEKLKGASEEVIHAIINGAPVPEEYQLEVKDD